MNDPFSGQSTIARETSPRSLSLLLNEACEKLAITETAPDAFWKLAAGLRVIRDVCTKKQWSECVELCRGHPVRDLVHQDPYSSHSDRRPRGYPGDAALIDYLYFRRPTESEVRAASPQGIAIFDAAVRTPSTFSVRSRREFAARAIDAAAQETSRPHVLCVACGHLREAPLSRALKDGLLGRFVAIDQDAESIGLVSAESSGYAVEPRCQSIGDLVQSSASDGTYDLIYALGLYDYLVAPSARMLTQRLFELLAPSGTLLIANFVPGIFEAAYMEAFMRWALVYRTPAELYALCHALRKSEVRGARVMLDDLGNIAYLTVRRV